MNRWFVKFLLSRITGFIEQKSGASTNFSTYFVSPGTKPYEVEHIWADHSERHTAEFSHPADFAEHRSRIGGLLLLPKSFNASYGDLDYADKLPHYNTQNLLARSLHPQCYDHNPGFLQFKEQSALPFVPHAEFNKADLDSRSQLYRQIAERIWNPADLLNGGQL